MKYEFKWVVIKGFKTQRQLRLCPEGPALSPCVGVWGWAQGRSLQRGGCLGLQTRQQLPWGSWWYHAVCRSGKNRSIQKGLTQSLSGARLCMQTPESIPQLCPFQLHHLGKSLGPYLSQPQGGLRRATSQGNMRIKWESGCKTLKVVAYHWPSRIIRIILF